MVPNPNGRSGYRPETEEPMSTGLLEALEPPPETEHDDGDELFCGEARMSVQTTIESHDTKKRSGSSDGAQTYDTPIT
jgi:hypothetical protein